MPPKKRSLEETDSNAQPKRPSKGQKRDKADKETENDENNDGEAAEHNSGISDDHAKQHKEMNNKKPEEYSYINQPFWDFEREHKQSQADGEDEDEDEEKDEADDEISEKYNKMLDSPNKMFPKPGTEHPEWKWQMMWEAWTMLCDYQTKVTYTCPDLFDMYVYNDFHSYGVMNLLENRLVEFDKEYSKKNGSLQRMWAIVAMLGHWVQQSAPMGNVLMTILQVDDGDRASQLLGVFGCAFLTVLNAIDRAGKLNKQSEFRDLGLVMSIYLDWGNGLDDYGIEDDDVSWCENVVAYAKKADIDLATVGCCGTSITLEEFDDVQALKSTSKADRWGWKKAFKEYKPSIMPSPLKGGKTFDITKWTRKQRAQYAFDSKDPLADIPEDVLKKDGIQLT